MNQLNKAATRAAQVAQGADFDDLVAYLKSILTMDQAELIKDMSAAFDEDPMYYPKG